MSAPHGPEPLADPITELRRLSDVLLDRLQPWLSTLDTPRKAPGADLPGTAHGDDGPDPMPPPSQGRCPYPLCALLGTVGGDRTELTRHLATHGLTALVTLREFLTHHGLSTPTPGAPDPTPPTPGDPVQGGPVAWDPDNPQVHRIRVRRANGDTPGTG